MCILGALSEADRELNPGPLDEHYAVISSSVAWPVRVAGATPASAALREATAEILSGLTTEGQFGLSWWNDAPGRTAGQVEALLEGRDWEAER
jgi:hypothetical protein